MFFYVSFTCAKISALIVPHLYTIWSGLVPLCPLCTASLAVICMTELTVVGQLVHQAVLAGIKVPHVCHILIHFA